MAVINVPSRFELSHIPENPPERRVTLKMIRTSDGEVTWEGTFTAEDFLHFVATAQQVAVSVIRSMALLDGGPRR